MTPEDFNKKLDDSKKNLNKELAKALLKAGFQIQKGAVLNFTGDDLPKVKRVKNTKRGKVGSYYKKSIKTGASGFNVGPRRITGHLSRSLFTQLTIDQPGLLEVQISAGLKEPVPYAASLEFGNPEKNILPRFYIGRSYDQVRQGLSKSLIDAVNVAFGV